MLEESGETAYSGGPRALVPAGSDSGVHLPQLELTTVESGLWEAFQSRKPGVEPSHPIVGRWKRSRSLGIDPEGDPESRGLVRGTALAERCERSSPLLVAADQVLTAGGEEVFSQAHYRLLITDDRGLILRSRAGGEFASTARRLRLIEGGRWAEEVQGTNAIGTALAEERAVAVAGCAHFVRSNHDLVCYASPIRDPFGRLVGILDATSHASAAHPAIQLAVLHGARAVEEALRTRAWVGAGRIEIGDQLRRTHEASLLVEWPGVVRVANGAARETFEDLLVGRSIESLIGRPWTELVAAVEAGVDQLELPDPATGSLRLQRVAGASGGTLAVLLTAERPRRAVPRPALSPRDPFARLVGSDPQMVRTKELAARLARRPLPVLLLAETGTGKGLLARAIHGASTRNDGPFVDLNCGALSPHLLESELFGYAPGAFTGAHRSGRDGKIQQATGGTLFLDEVAEMSPTLQAMLLKVLEEGRYYRVGESRPRQSDFRLIAATCRDLDAMVADGSFRRDLYYRLGGARLSLPALRDRTDLGELAEALLDRLAEGAGAPFRPRLASESLSALEAHTWPGNVRELRMVLEFALAMARGPTLEVEDLPASVFTGTTERQRVEAGEATLSEREREALLQALRETGGNMSAAARRLGITRSTIYRMIERHGISLRRSAGVDDL